MKTSNHLKKPFGTAKWVDIVHARYLSWEDAFDVEFEDGLSFLEPHRTIRKANGITTGAVPTSVELELETRSGFFVHYDNGQTAEVSWSFIRELPPKPARRSRPKAQLNEDMELCLKVRGERGMPLTGSSTRHSLGSEC